MSLRLFFAMMVAMAMTFAPLAMPAAEAGAAPAGHHPGMNMAGHCEGQKAPDQPKMDHQKSCCVAGCIAAATLADASAEALAPGSDPERPRLDSFRRGILTEIATPPPRAA